MENSVDPTHVEWLHGHWLAAQRVARGLSAPAHYGRRHVKIGFERFRHGIVKKRVVEGGSEADADWTVGHPLVFPNALRVGAHGQHRMQIRVPVDDEHTLHWWYACYLPERDFDAQESVPVYEVPWRDERGEPLLDFVDGTDVWAWVSQGAIADRTREHLVASDEGVALLRRVLFEELERVSRGEDPLGVLRDADENRFIELPQEHEKYGDGRAFLRQALELSHSRYSPIRAEIARAMGLDVDSDATP
jgi:5,5'-dehydrodivanillate O-demethylase